MSESEDRRQVRRVALSVGLYVGIASALIVTAGVGILVAVILATSRRERDGDEGPHLGSGRPPIDDFVVDTHQVLPVVITLGVIGVLLLGVVAWLAARRSVRPIGDALRRQRNFVADASHELRTPLTALTSRIQVLQRRHKRGDPIEGSITDLRRDAAMMSDLLNDLLLAAEDGERTSSEPTPVAAAVDAAVQSLRPVADDASLTLSIDVRQVVAVALPRVTLVRVIIALVDNAMQYSPAGATVTITIDRYAGMAAIRVADAGPGITGIPVDQIFERFARSTESGRRRGFGLGLSLVRDVALRAGGAVVVEHTSPAGTTFLLTLPLATPASVTPPPAAGQ